MKRKIKKESSLEIIVQFTLLFLVIFLPLIFYPYLSNTISAPKFTLLIIISSFLVLVWLGNFIFKREIQIRYSFLNLPIFFLLLTATLSTITSMRIETSFWGERGWYQGIFTFSSYLLLWFFLVNYSQEKGKLLLLIGLSISGTLVSVIAFLQHYKLNIGFSHFIPPQRAFSTLGNPIFLGALLVLTLPVTLGLFLFYYVRKPSGFFSWFYGVIFLFN